MIYEYSCLYDYIKEDDTLIATVSKIFETIKTASGNIFDDYDNELFGELAYQYYYERGKRPLKILYAKYAKNVDWTDATAAESLFSHIGKIAYSRFGKNWEDVYKAYFETAYNPLENYDMEQKRTPDLDYDVKTNRDQKTKVDTSGKTKVVPFNASTSTLTGESEGDSETSEQALYNEINTHTDETGTDTLTRHGNIGVTTSQQMLQSELDLRKLDFIARIFRDIDRVILRNYYPTSQFYDL